MVTSRLQAWFLKNWYQHQDHTTMDYKEGQPPHSSRLPADLYPLHWSATTVYFYQGQPGTLGQHPPSKLTDQNIHHLRPDNTASQHRLQCMCPANERRRYNVSSSLIGWAHSQMYPGRSWSALPREEKFMITYETSASLTRSMETCNYINNLVQDCGIFSVLMMEILQSCAKPSCGHSNSSAQDTISSALEIEKVQLTLSRWHGYSMWLCLSTKHEACQTCRDQFIPV